MKLTDEIIDDYMNGKLSASEAEALERQISSALKASAPEVPSKRMWNAIRAQIVQTPAPQESIWDHLMNALSGRRLRFGMAGLAAALFVGIGLQFAQKPVPMPEPKAEIATPEPVKAKAPAKKPLELAAVKPLASEPVRRAPSEVERALAEQDLDGVINTMLEERQAAGHRPALAMSRRPSRSNAVETVSYGAPSEAPASSDFASKAEATATPSRLDSNGFWNFGPAAVALNRRDWLSAKRELQAASLQAPEAAERAFARSSLRLLDQGSTVLDETTGLQVESAGVWQIFVDHHLARYSGGVVTRMPGLRGEGNELLLDMAFDRASFSPGTRFVKLADESSTTVKGPQGETVQSTEFRAQRGADYLLRANELRLK